MLVKKIVFAFTTIGVSVAIILLLAILFNVVNNHSTIESIILILGVPFLAYDIFLCGFWDDAGLLGSKICNNYELIRVLTVGVMGVLTYTLIGIIVAKLANSLKRFLHNKTK